MRATTAHSQGGVNSGELKGRSVPGKGGEYSSVFLPESSLKSGTISVALCVRTTSLNEAPAERGSWPGFSKPEYRVALAGQCQSEDSTRLLFAIPLAYLAGRRISATRPSPRIDEGSAQSIHLCLLTKFPSMSALSTGRYLTHERPSRASREEGNRFRRPVGKPAASSELAADRSCSNSLLVRLRSTVSGVRSVYLKPPSDNPRLLGRALAHESARTVLDTSARRPAISLVGRSLALPKSS